MYSYFRGVIDQVFDDRVIIEVNNIGYEIYMPENEIIKLKDRNDTVKIHTYFHVREDDMKLFGFLSQNTLEFFKKLILVSGVGPKMALGIISNISADDMCIAIATENIITLKSIPGIGPKMAQKIIFELKDKVLKDEFDNIKEKSNTSLVENKNVSEAVTALQVLGYSDKQIKEVINSLNIGNDKVEEIIKKCLKKMQSL